MHPIADSRSRLGLYVASWVPIAGILVTVLVSRGGLLWTEGVALGMLLGLGYAVIGLSVWYVCRANPIRGAGFLKAFFSHAVASLLYASLLQILARILAVSLPGLRSGWDGLAGRLDPQLPVLFFLGILIYLLTAAFYYLLLAFEASREDERHRERLRAMAGESELRALRAQLNPHFLFNSLHSISSLTTSDPETARAMCIRLADFFRMNLGLGERTTVTLDEELGLLSHYLAVEKIRLGDRLTVLETVDDAARRVRIPPLLLQPLVENAVIHGIATLTEGGELAILAERLSGRLRIQVDNPYDPDAPDRRGGGRGMENVRRRLAAHFGSEGRMQTESDRERYRVVLSIPLEDA